MSTEDEQIELFISIKNTTEYILQEVISLSVEVLRFRISIHKTQWCINLIHLISIQAHLEKNARIVTVGSSHQSDGPSGV